MPQNPTQAVQPYLLYEDTGTAVDWLCDAFGLVERFRLADEAGAVNHAEVVIDGDHVIMLGSPGGDYQSPANSGHVHSQVYVYVDDVDAHFAQAKAAGATILEEPATSSTAIDATARSISKATSGTSRPMCAMSSRPTCRRRRRHRDRLSWLGTNAARLLSEVDARLEAL